MGKRAGRDKLSVRRTELETRNRYGVVARQWKRWSRSRRAVFNATFAMLRDNESLVKHPHDVLVPKGWWRTTCWNAAWIAASAHHDASRLIRE